MKKVLLTLVLAFTGIFAANAQLWIGGGLGAQINKDNTSLNVAPEIGYAFNNHWQLALGAGYGFDKSDFGKLNVLTLEPYFRYVATTIGDKFSLFFDVTATSTTIGDKFSLFFDVTGDFGLLDASGWAATLRPGIAWMATEHWTAAFRFGFAGYDHGYYGADNGFFLNCDLAAPQIRLYYNF